MLKNILSKFSVRETLSYTWVGLVGVGIDFFCFVTLRSQQFYPVAATTLSASFAAALTFPLNRHFTFRKTDDVKKRFITYIVINLFGVVLGAAIMLLGNGVFSFRAGYVKIFIIFVVAATQFLLNKFIAFK